MNHDLFSSHRQMICPGLLSVCLVSFSGFSPVVHAAEFLTEKDLLEDFRQNGVASSRVKAIESEGVLKERLLTEAYRPRLKASWGYQTSHEKPLNQFQPVFSPAEQWSLGAASQLPYGLSTQIELFGNKSTIESMNVNDASQVGMRVSASIDLWRNLAGRLDAAKLTSARSDREKARISAAVARKQAEIQVRKAFWELAANQLSTTLAQQLELSAEKQVKEALMRARAGVADKGEVARYKSQRESRNGSLLMFRYEREKIIEGLAREIGTVDSASNNRGRSILTRPVAENDMEKSQGKVLGCIAQISSLNGPDLSATFFDEAVALLAEKRSSERVIAEAHSMPTIALSTSVQSSGVDQGYDAARQDWTSDQRSGNSVALVLDVPLAPAAYDAGAAQAALQEAAIAAELRGLQNQLTAVHASTVKGIELLTKGLQFQTANSQNLEESYKSMKSKYRQGRVPLSSLIFEQDNLFQSKLQEINLKKQIAHAVLDYFAVFTEFQCPWNRI